MEYSKEFNELLERLGEVNLINGSFVRGNVSLAKWEEMRRFIAQAINQDGSILDIGCANGFLLRCLQEWSNYNLIPYGIDVSEPHIKEAHEIFPDQKDNFVVLRAEEIKNISKLNLPGEYPTIY